MIILKKKDGLINSNGTINYVGAKLKYNVIEPYYTLSSNPDVS